MNPKVNWQQLTDTLKGEVQRISSEIKKFDLQSVLTPSAQKKVKEFEKRYAFVLKRLHKVQRQADREFNRVLRQVKSQQATVMGVVKEQRSRLERMSDEFRTRFYTKPTKTRTARKKTPKRRRATKKA